MKMFDLENKFKVMFDICAIALTVCEILMLQICDLEILCQSHVEHLQ